MADVHVRVEDPGSQAFARTSETPELHLLSAELSKFTNSGFTANDEACLFSLECEKGIPDFTPVLSGSFCLVEISLPEGRLACSLESFNYRDW